MTSTPPIVITATPLADEGLSVKHDIKIGDWVGAGWQVIGLTDTHLTARHRLDDLATATRPAIELFEIRVRELAARTASGHIAFTDGVDLAYSAAVWSGLVDSVGDDAVQKILAKFFGGISKAVSN